MGGGGKGAPPMPGGGGKGGQPQPQPQMGPARHANQTGQELPPRMPRAPQFRGGKGGQPQGQPPVGQTVPFPGRRILRDDVV